MNKLGKILLLTAILGIASSVVVASEYTKFSRKFIKNFKDCDKYAESTESVFEDETFKTSRKILGWKNGYCRYEETMKSAFGEYIVRCQFPHVQVDELYDAMKDKSKEPIRYQLELFATKTNPNTGEETYVVAETREIKGNKAYVTWAKYENNPYFCTPEKISPTIDLKPVK